MKVSVVVPSKDQGCFIAYALESLIRQYRGDNLEVIVRDCESKDQTSDVLARYRDLPFVRIICEKDRGQSDALNKGFSEATGDVFCWLNSDDIMHSDAIDRVIRGFSEHPEADIVFGEAAFINEDGEVLGRFPTANPTLRRLRNRCVISQPSVFFRRHTFFAVGGLNADRRYCMDYELWLRFVLNGYKFVMVPEVLSYTRLHGNTKTFTGGIDFIDEICDMQANLLNSVSPIWRIYRSSRTPELQRYAAKLQRFMLATLATSAREPSGVPIVLAATIERLTAQLSASIRQWRQREQ